MKKIKWNGEKPAQIYKIKDKKSGLNKLSVIYKDIPREVTDATYKQLVKKHGKKKIKVE